ncbi:MAG: methylenetetrahydrofolate--tRNA-(uracil(54)-C(5))-methyltransferase (FADH(2)-oxidizing) TrmFO [Oscillospiraceae bacterium]
MSKIRVIGAGLAGCEAANTLAGLGHEVVLYEQKPNRHSAAHKLDGFAELVCSNSLKAARVDSAAGLLKAEMRLLGSVCLEVADTCSVAAGGALAVDRAAFESYITERVLSNPNIAFKTGEVTKIDGDEYTIVATGPLTTDALSSHIKENFCAGSMYFFDAAAPIVSFSSIAREKVFFASRYGKGGDDYVNCPFDKAGYDSFYEALVSAETAELRGFENDMVFEGCMPIEVLAKRGYDAMRFGPLKPVGLVDPTTGEQPYACVQLRMDNAAASLYNLVGFQTHLKFSEQRRVFSLIPGLENAEFVRYGVMHRNTYLHSPGVLNEVFQAKNSPKTFFAGQMTGVEGYIESAASGIVAGMNCARIMHGCDKAVFSRGTATGSLGAYISNEGIANFQPMNINFGIMEIGKIKARGRRERRVKSSEAALSLFESEAAALGIKTLKGAFENEGNS